MKCSDAHKLMGDYLEGDARPRGRAASSGTIWNPAPTAGSCSRISRTSPSQARELPRLEPADAAWPAILRRVARGAGEAAAPPRRPGRKWFAAIFAPGRLVYTGAAALLLLAVVGGLVAHPASGNRTAGPVRAGPLHPGQARGSREVLQARHPGPDRSRRLPQSGASIPRWRPCSNGISGRSTRPSRPARVRSPAPPPISRARVYLLGSL